MGSPACVSILALLFRMPARFFYFFRLPYSKMRHPLNVVSNQRQPYSAPTSADILSLITDEFHVVSTSRTYFPSITLKC
jgi:hypothetical protein